MAKKVDSSLFSAILYILVGILLVAAPGTALAWAIYIVGGLFILSGILELIKKNWIGGAISAVIGLLIILIAKPLIDIIAIILGVLIAVKGIVGLINELKRKKVTVLGILFPALTIVAGALLAFGNGKELFIQIIGVFLAIDGVLGLIASFNKN